MPKGPLMEVTLTVLVYIYIFIMNHDLSSFHPQTTATPLPQPSFRHGLSAVSDFHPLPQRPADGRGKSHPAQRGGDGTQEQNQAIHLRLKCAQRLYLDGCEIRNKKHQKEGGKTCRNMLKAYINHGIN